MKRRTRFRFVDFAAAAQPGFRSHVLPVEEVPCLVARYGGGECYASIFHFPPEILLYLAEHRVGGRPSIAGYDGRVRTMRLLTGWNRRLRVALPEREVTALVHSAFVRPYPYAYGCHDEVIREFCPFVENPTGCADYRGQHPRTAARNPP